MDKNTEKPNRLRKILLITAVSALVVLLACYVVIRVIIKPGNASPAKVAEKAFLAVYSMDYEKFLEYSIYSDECQKYLRMEVFDICNEMEGEFQNSKAYADEYRMTVDKVNVEKYAKTDAGYGTGLELLKTMNPEVVVDELDGIALARIDYALKYSDGQEEHGTEEYWVYCVHGSWYSHPLVNVSMEEIYE